MKCPITIDKNINDKISYANLKTRQTYFHSFFSSTPFLKVPGLKLEVPARFFVFFPMLLVNFVRQLAFFFTKQTAK